MNPLKPLDRIDASDSIFDGMLFGFNEESGPILRLNLSSLNEREAISTIIHGITAVGLGEEGISGLFGPIPVPYNAAYRAILYIFKIRSSSTLIEERFCFWFLIFKKEMIRFIANVYLMIESLLKIYQETYLVNEADLKEEVITSIFQEFITKLKLKPRKRLFRVNNGITVEFEEQKIMFGNELTVLIDEKEKIIYSYSPFGLEKELKERTNKIIHHLNHFEYQNSFAIKKIATKKHFTAILETKNVTIVQ